jgi:ribosomal protein S25
MAIIGGAVQQPMQVPTLCSQIDLVPTVLHAMGLDTQAYPFSKNILDTTQTQFAFYAFNDGFALLTPQDTIIVDAKANMLLQGDNDSLKQQAQAVIQRIMEDIEKRASQAAASGNKGGVGAAPEANDAELEGDEMLPAAVDVILETNQASVSMLQRRLKLGYARAARIVDEMEEKGIVGPFQGSKPREILITKEQWATMRGNQPEQMELDDIPFDEGVPEELD